MKTSKNITTRIAPSGKRVAAVALAIHLVMAAFPRTCNGQVYASDVVSVTGTFGNPTVLSSSLAAAAAAVLGTNDGRFIQLSDNTSITVSLGVDVGPTGTLRIFTYDSLFPAAATVQISADGLSFITIPPPSDSLWYDTNACGRLDIPIDLPLPARFHYVRLTDLPSSIDGDTTSGGTLGFDLDAVAFLQPDPGPQLRIHRHTASQIDASWSTNATCYVLESSSSLSDPTWSAVTNTVLTVAGEHSVTIDAVASQTYFRLRKQ